MFRLLCAIAIILAFSGASQADTLEVDLTKYDPAVAELSGISPDAFTPQGLHIKLSGVSKELSLVTKEVRRGRLIVTMEYELLSGPAGTTLILRLDNADKKRRMDLGNRVDWTRSPDGKEQMYHGSFMRYYKDGKLSAERAHGAPFNKLILIKEGLRLYGCFGAPEPEGVVGAEPGPTTESINYPSVYFGEDCDEYRVGLTLIVPGDAGKRDTEVLIKRLAVWGPQVKRPGAQVSGAFQPPDPIDETKVAAPGPKIWRFDFGPIGQELAKGFIPVSQRTMYSKEDAYGWVTGCKPFDYGWEYKELSDDKAAKLGLYLPSPRTSGWRQSWERTSNWMMSEKVAAMNSASSGYTKLEYFSQFFDLNTPIERDMVGAFRPYGCTYDYRTEADLWELRGAFYVDDDLSTHFLVDLPNDRYTALIGVGYGASTLGRGSPFAVEAQGRLIKKGIESNWRRCNYFRVDDLEVKNGQLDLRLFADRRVAMNTLTPWGLGPSWQINYLILLPSDAKDDIKREEWKIILDRGEKIRKVTFSPGEPLVARLSNGYAMVNEKPIIPVLWQFYQPPETYDHYPYYLWGNTNAMVNIEAIYRASQHFMKSDWFKYSAADDYPWSEIDKMNVCNRQGKLAFARVDSLLNFVPEAISGEGGEAEDSRGRRDRWNAQPPLNSRLGHEMQREARAMASFQIRRHPSLLGSYLYEERWHPDGIGYDFQSVGQYHEYLQRKYGTVEKLNAEWGSDYKGFDAIIPPPDANETANWANFRAFRMYAQVQDIKFAHDTLETLEPEHLTFGAKGDYPTASWYYAPYVKLFSWYSPMPARVAAQTYHAAPGCVGSLFYCPYAYTDGRKQLDHKPGPRNYPGRDDFHLGYVHMLDKLFAGTKVFYCEEYNDSLQHMFHRTKQIQYQTAEGLCKKWTGELAFFDDPAFDYPEVTVDEAPLEYTAAQALTYRLTPLICPAKFVKPSVAFYVTDESFFGAGGHSVFATDSVEKLLKSIHVPCDVVRDEIFDRMGDYEVVILGGFSSAVRPDRADKIKEFVKRGGKLILLAGADTRSAINLKTGRELPLFGLGELAGVRVIDSTQRPISVNEPLVCEASEFTPSLKPGEALYPELRGATWKLEPLEGSKTLVRCKDVVLGACNRDGSILTFVGALEQPGWLPAEDRDHSRSRVLARLFADFFARWQPKPALNFAGATSPEDINAGALHADALPGEPGVAGDKTGYWLVGLTNAAAEDQSLSVKMNFLPPGRYEVTDVTGERPNIIRKTDRGLALAPDPERRYVSVVAKDLSADELKAKGLAVTVAGRKALVLLVRPAGWKVWQSAPDATLNYMTSAAVTVVVGKDAPEAERKAAESVRTAIAARGVPAKRVDSSEVKTKATKHEVRIKSDLPGRKKEDPGYLTDTFLNEPVDTDATLVLVGSEATNPLVRHLGKPGTFTYDKVLEKVTQDYPGAGRGIIATVDTVNLPYYDATDHTRDAILIGGSDAAGTAAAVEQFLASLARSGKPFKRPDIQAIPNVEALPQ